MTSSAMTPRPSGRCSSWRAGGGLVMSKRRWSAKPASAIFQLVSGTNKKTSGTVMISSQMMAWLSFLPPSARPAAVQRGCRRAAGRRSRRVCRRGWGIADPPSQQRTDRGAKGPWCWGEESDPEAGGEQDGGRDAGGQDYGGCDFGHASGMRRFRRRMWRADGRIANYRASALPRNLRFTTQSSVFAGAFALALRRAARYYSLR